MTVCVLLHCKGARHFWITQEKINISWFSMFYRKNYKKNLNDISCVWGSGYYYLTPSEAGNNHNHNNKSLIQQRYTGRGWYLFNTGR